jgi:hypothetical protein
MNNYEDFMSCDWSELEREVCGRPLRKGFSCTVDGFWSSWLKVQRAETGSNQR